MFFSAACMAAMRLAFSLANDSAQARNNETNRYCRVSRESKRGAQPLDIGQHPLNKGLTVFVDRRVECQRYDFHSAVLRLANVPHLNSSTAMDRNHHLSHFELPAKPI
jgi:hypothetical protein